TAIRSYLTEQTVGGVVGFIFMAISGSIVFALVYKTSGHMAAHSGIPTEGVKTIGIFAAIFSSLLVGLPIGALAAWFLRTAYLEPMGLTMLLARFHRTIEGQRPDPAMKTRIENATSNLRKVSKLGGLFD